MLQAVIVAGSGLVSTGSKAMVKVRRVQVGLSPLMAHHFSWNELCDAAESVEELGLDP